MLGKSSTDSQGALMGFLAILTGNLDYMPVSFSAWISCSKGFPDSSVGKKKKKKNLPAMLETWVQSLVWGDPLEKEKATHSSILAWRIP